MSKFISLKKAAKISGYTPDYLGYLIRKGKLKGERVARDWFTTEEALKSYLLTKKFLPIRAFLSPKTHPRTTFIFALLIISIIIFCAIIIFNPPLNFQKSAGDFETQTELQKAKAVINQEQGQEIKEIEVTSYLSDETGEIEISVKSQEQK